MDLKIYNRIDELNATIAAAEKAKAEAIQERESYYWKISLCNSSDSFNDFKEANPNHPLLQYCHVQRPEHYGCLSDVIVRILRCDISKEDFLAFARLVVNPNVGESDFRHFEFNLNRE
jgi:hypothetical protein